MDQIFFQDVIDGNSEKSRDECSIAGSGGSIPGLPEARRIGGAASYEERIREQRESKKAYEAALQAGRAEMSRLSMEEANASPTMAIKIADDKKDLLDDMVTLSKKIRGVDSAIEKEARKEKEKARKTLVFKWPGEITPAVGKVWAARSDGNPREQSEMPVPKGVSGDESNGFRVAAYYGDELLYGTGLGWFGWDNIKWQQLGDEDEVYNKIQGISKHIMGEIHYHRGEGLTAGYSEIEHEIIEEEYASVCSDMKRVFGAMNAAKAARRWLSVSADKLDNNEMLLNTPEGEILLGTGEVRGNGRENYCTMVTSTGMGTGVCVGETLVEGGYSGGDNGIWDGEVVCPKWMKFLRETFYSRGTKGEEDHIDYELIEYVQRLVGYCSTGSVRENKVFFFFGGGRNGKSVFMNVVSKILGDYSRVMPRGMILKGDKKEKQRDLACVRGTRLLVDSEVGEDSRLDENFIKTVTGAEKLDSRGLYKMNFAYMPSFKIICCTNNKPIVESNDYAIWQRIKLVPFKNTVLEKDQNKNLVVELEMEAEGILQWIVDGARKWNREGFNKCKAVDKATEEYRLDEDVFSRFVSDNIAPTGDHNHMITKKDIFERYKKWAEDNGLPAKEPTPLGKDLAKAVLNHPVFKGSNVQRQKRTSTYSAVKFLDVF